jgi:hypothetical protein
LRRGGRQTGDGEQRDQQKAERRSCMHKRSLLRT